MPVDSRTLAQLALVAIALVLVGALLASGRPPLDPLDERAAVLAAIAGVLLLLALGRPRSSS